MQIMKNNLLYGLILAGAMLVSGCEKVLFKQRLTALDGEWLLSEERVVVTHTDGEVSMDTTVIDAGYFTFTKFTKKEKRDYEKGEENIGLLGDDKGTVSYSMYLPNENNITLAIGSNTDMKLFPVTKSGFWGVDQVIGFKPKMYMGRNLEWEVEENTAERLVLIYDMVPPTIDIASIQITMILERP